MKPMTHDLRKQIKIRIKNKLDISDLIRDVDIQGEDLSYAIIKDFDRVEQNLSRTIFNNCVIGEEDKVTTLSNNKMYNCQFENTIFLGVVYLRRCDLRDSNFQFAQCQNVEWQYSDCRGANFCEACLRLGTDYFYKAIVDENLFRDLTKYLNIKVTMKEPEPDKTLEEKYGKG
jgi:uncharacterized protein YjbI with pentapeptide repeats